MRPHSGRTPPGESLPAIALRTASGEAVDLARWRGQPLLVVCVRYYG
jgi:hypothetical protein